jgi:ribosome recycling factor
MSDFDINDIKRRMSGAVEALKKEFSGLRTGRASASLLDPIKVEAYGTPTPINQVGTVTVPEPRMLSVQVWDASLAPAVDKAIRNSSLGLNPVWKARPSAFRSRRSTKSVAPISPRPPAAMPSRPGLRCAMCAGTAWMP